MCPRDVDLVYVCLAHNAAPAVLTATCRALVTAGKCPLAWQLAFAGVATSDDDVIRALIERYVQACTKVFVMRGINPWNDPTVRIALETASKNNKPLEFQA